VGRGQPKLLQAKTEVLCQNSLSKLQALGSPSFLLWLKVVWMFVPKRHGGGSSGDRYPDTFSCLLSVGSIAAAFKWPCQKLGIQWTKLNARVTQVCPLPARLLLYLLGFFLDQLNGSPVLTLSAAGINK
jgi:hypothetical protein